MEWFDTWGLPLIVFLPLAGMLILMGTAFYLPLFRLIMVVAAANVGSLIASVLFPVVVLPWLAPEVGGIQGVLDLLVQGPENGVRIVRGGFGL